MSEANTMTKQTEALKRIAAYPFSRAEELSVEQMREIAREALAQASVDADDISSERVDETDENVHEPVVDFYITRETAKNIKELKTNWALCASGSKFPTEKKTVPVFIGYTTPPQPKEPEQEPVAWHVYFGNEDEPNYVCLGEKPIEKMAVIRPLVFGDTTPYVATPQPQRTAAEGEDTRRAWVGLTDEDKSKPDLGKWIELSDEWMDGYAAGLGYAEAKLKEKNT